MNKLKKALWSNLKQVKDLLSNILPKNKTEILLFLFWMLFYLSYALILALNTSVVDNYAQYGDLYFSYDNTGYFHFGITYAVGHPLIQLFMKPFMFVGGLFAYWWGLKAKTVLFVILCTFLVVMPIIYIYRYLKEIIGLKGGVLYLLVSFYAFFMTNLTLCFTTESFTISVFLLTFMTYYYSACIAKKEEVTFSTNVFFAIGLGGVTISNFAKGMIPILFTKEKLGLKVAKITIIGVAFLLIVYSVLSAIGGFVDKFTDTNYLNGFIKTIIIYFWGAPILSSDVVWEALIWDSTMNMINFSLHYSWWQYLFVGILFCLCIWSVIKGYRNSLIQMLVLLFGFDIVFHVFIGYGLFESFIYGGHWIYVVPLFLGWLSKALNTKSQKVFLVLMTCLLLILAINNITQLIVFINMAIDKYPVLMI